MSKVRLMSFALIIALCIGVLAGCGSKPAASSGNSSASETTSAPANSGTSETTSAPADSSSSSKLTDGTFKVEYDKFDAHGYKGQLELTVSGGKITEVKYDEVTKDGKFKSQDAAYKEQMKAVSKTYPEEAYNKLKQDLLAKQSADVDTVTGATTATSSFKALAKYAIEEMSMKGNSAPATISAK